MSDKTMAKRLAAYAGMRELMAKEGTKSAFNSARVCSYEAVELLYTANECKELNTLGDEINAAKVESGIGVACISCYVDLLKSGEPYGVIRESIDAVKSCIDLAEKVGSPYVHHTLVTRLSGRRDNYREVLKMALTAAKEIAEYASEGGIGILYEPQGVLFNGLSGYSELFDKMLDEHENVGLCLDVGNTLWVDEDCYALAEKYARYIRHVHLKDYVLDSDDKRYTTHSGRTIKEVALGTGIIDLERVFDILKRADYKGYLSIEDNSGAGFCDTTTNAHKVVSALTEK